MSPTGNTGARSRGDAAFLWSAPAGALRLRLLVPLAAALVLLVLLRPSPGGSGLLASGYVALAVLAAVAGLAWVAVWASGTLAPVAPPSAAEHLRLTAGAVRSALLSELAWLSATALVAAVASLGLALRGVPGAGSILFPLWHYSVGVVGFLIASVMALVAAASLPLLAPSAAATPASPIATLTACVSYLRRRPLTYALSCLASVGGTVVALVPFALVSFVTVSAVGGLARWASEGGSAGTVLAAYSRELFVALGGGFSGPPETIVLAAWCAAFAVASLQTGLTRTFLILRREVDGVALPRTS